MIDIKSNMVLLSSTYIQRSYLAVKTLKILAFECVTFKSHTFSGFSFLYLMVGKVLEKIFAEYYLSSDVW